MRWHVRNTPSWQVTAPPVSGILFPEISYAPPGDIPIIPHSRQAAVAGAGRPPCAWARPARHSRTGTQTARLHILTPPVR
jgi:hypothetical protein